MSTVTSEAELMTLQSSLASGTVLVVTAGEEPFRQFLLDGRHTLEADEPKASGGGDSGPNPYELLLMSLGSCTSMTLRLYASHKNWPLERVLVRLRHMKVHARDCQNCDDAKSMIDRIERTIELVGPLDAEQRRRLLEIASHCPVHRTLTSKIDIQTVLPP